MYSYGQKLISYTLLSLNMFLWYYEEQSQRFHEFQKCFQIKKNWFCSDVTAKSFGRSCTSSEEGKKKKSKPPQAQQSLQVIFSLQSESNWDCEQIQFYTLSSLWKQSCWVEHVAGVLQTPSASRSLSVQPSLHLSLQFYWAAAGMQNETVSHSVCWQCANNVHLTIATYMLEGGQAAGTKERGQR